MIFRENEEWDKALEEFDKAKIIFEENCENNELALTYYDIGLLWKNREDTNKARMNIDIALTMFQKMGMKLWEEKCRKALSELEL